MSTEYHQLPSQQGLMPLELLTETDPWLIAATSNLSLDAWAPPRSKAARSPLFEHSGHDSSIEQAWKSVTSPEVTPISPMRVKSPIVGVVSAASNGMPSIPKDFYTTASKIDAWSSAQSSPMELKSAPKSLKSHLMNPTPLSLSLPLGMGMPSGLSQSMGLPQTTLLSQSMGMSPLSSSQDDIEAKQIEDELAIQNRYKTELCKSYTETGVCRYGTKCQFAHGKEEVRPILRHPKYKTETCKTFHSTGTCPYGIRCRFIHTRAKDEPLIYSDEELMMSGKLTPPPGIPVPQWSKSWSPTSSLGSMTPPKKHFSNKKHGLGKITLIEAVPEY